ncbi:MAG: hypothetical protein HQK59_02710 [Deltaproteobacteria bacterium]|nr:hypothetical protein [Deltaproteobacteria bacterium]
MGQAASGYGALKAYDRSWAKNQPIPEDNKMKTMTMRNKAGVPLPERCDPCRNNNFGCGGEISQTENLLNLPHCLKKLMVRPGTLKKSNEAGVPRPERCDLCGNNNSGCGGEISQTENLLNLCHHCLEKLTVHPGTLEKSVQRFLLGNVI